MSGKLLFPGSCIKEIILFGFLSRQIGLFAFSLCFDDSYELDSILR